MPEPTDDRGETAVASALLLPAILFGVFLALQAMIGYYIRSVASAAATDAAAFYAHEGVTQNQARQYARMFILDQAGSFVDASTLVVTPRRAGDEVVVTVTGRTNLALSIPLTVQASAPIERFDPQGN